MESVPPVLANDLRLEQVFVNLLLNAAQAIPRGMRTRTRSECSRARRK